MEEMRNQTPRLYRLPSEWQYDRTSTRGTDAREVLGDDADFAQDFLQTMRDYNMVGSFVVSYPSSRDQRGFPIGYMSVGRNIIVKDGHKDVVFICEDGRLRYDPRTPYGNGEKSFYTGGQVYGVYDLPPTYVKAQFLPGLATFRKYTERVCTDVGMIEVMRRHIKMQEMPLRDALPRLAAILVQSGPMNGA